MSRPWRHPSVSANAYAADPASVGIARNPIPTIPSANRVAANCEGPKGLGGPARSFDVSDAAAVEVS